MKIPGAHLHMVSNKCTNFQKNLHSFYTTCVDKIMSTVTDEQTDRHRQTDRQMDIE